MTCCSVTVPSPLKLTETLCAVTLLNEESGDEVVLTAPYILDATELGYLLELAKIEHLMGAESQLQTGERHAVTGDPQPHDQQAITWCFAVDYLLGEDQLTDRLGFVLAWPEYARSTPR